MDFDKIMDNADKMQKEMHKFIEDAMVHAWVTKKKRLSYQDIKDVYYLMKISELEEIIEENRQSSSPYHNEFFMR